MTDDLPTTPFCPHCSEEIASVTVRQLKAANANTAAKFWTCPECETILGST